MKLSNTKKLAGVLALSMAISIAPGQSSASSTYENPSSYEINKLLTEAALEHNVPPEIVKAIAYRESAWKQFKEDGTPVMNLDGDNGIGIMQITNNSNYDTDRLKTDIKYNIDSGIKILKSKLKLEIPSVGDGDPDVLENWYFAVLAYNGEYQVNSPVFKNNKEKIGQRNYGTYQDGVYNLLSRANNNMFEGDKVDNILFGANDFIYKEENNYLYYDKWKYNLTDKGHMTKHKFEKGDLVISPEKANFHSAPSTKDDKYLLDTLNEGESEVLEVQHPFVYDITYKDAHAENWNAEIMKQYVWYDVDRQQNQGADPVYTASGALEYMGKRLAGAGRFGTAETISKQGWETADTVVIANGRKFPDALAGAPLAHKYNAPLLLTESDTLPASTKREIERLGAKKVFILGGEAAISSSVEKAVDGLKGVSIERISGADRYITAAKIADKVNPNPERVIVASGKNFPDALSAAPYAARNGYPILLTHPEKLNESAKEILQGVKNPIVAGGKAAISDKVFNSIAGAERIKGADRYETSVKMAEKLPVSDKVFIATGLEFADALAGSVLAAKENTPVILTQKDSLPSSIKRLINTNQYDEFILFGGNNAVNVDQELGEMIKARQ
ncbi:transglycosylase SLT domain-containing protein [Rossellomorea vietnamensis]|uniref:Transglycosylase SLT domain-containing protein n=1 Tax=Rossellomorea vietnamensis TaxID=218284 RepID=A0A5D4NW55_9BACI|nr:cell wall-binding repeat-containing protein [Rossellomorea vietnamensis]TYS17668.1 transglycosylase SLT domain-containing protein [Rossellomorea vietnamensis]